MELALFPLKTVLLPGNKLPLKVFEARYTDMVADCLREDKAFGVVLIYRGTETSSDADIYNIGTSARVIDWQNRDDGLLGITVAGEQRFEVLSSKIQPNGLIVADVKLIEDDCNVEVPDQYYYMSELLKHVSSGKNTAPQTLDFNATMYQLIYLLPLANQLKQQLLEVPICHDRAMILHAELIRLGVIQYIKPG
ncbi:MAG: LON peptidase substrate-binding domain-containing protein [Gammaproteobacteria bacterium]|nr:LON peptidase substrate-binding domain-containing protein [Gammaproteobacteria bacterium]MBL6999022.1 LON peptidase substrate-binding domain-containing protein [Gammaproteobacteria bacterium]